MGKLTVECAKDAGVKHLIWSTLPDTAALSGGSISVPHFVSKAKVRLTALLNQEGTPSLHQEGSSMSNGPWSLLLRSPLVSCSPCALIFAHSRSWRL